MKENRTKEMHDHLKVGVIAFIQGHKIEHSEIKHHSTSINTVSSRAVGQIHIYLNLNPSYLLHWGSKHDPGRRRWGIPLAVEHFL